MRAGKELARFIMERDAALLSLDKDTIQQFMRKNGVACPKDDRVFGAGVHKAILHINSASLDAKLYSMRWLREHGFSPD